MDGFVLVDVPRRGTENMALDQHMLERAAETQVPLLRFYQWSAPTLSLGYFQPFQQRQQHSPSRQIDVVRRATGGGAIVHHHDWTYSLALPDTLLDQVHPQVAAGNTAVRDRAGRNIGASTSVYHCVHDAVIDWLRAHACAATKWSLAEGGPPAEAGCGVTPNATRNAAVNSALPIGGRGERAAPAGCSFLCFERRSPGDVVIGEFKVMGSAQRRMRGGLLQHGSLLLSRSEYAPSLPGLAQLGAPQTIQQAYLDFCERVTSRMAASLPVSFQRVPEITQLVPGVAPESEGKFADSTWTTRV